MAPARRATILIPWELQLRPFDLDNVWHTFVFDPVTGATEPSVVPELLTYPTVLISAYSLACWKRVAGNSHRRIRSFTVIFLNRFRSHPTGLQCIGVRSGPHCELRAQVQLLAGEHHRLLFDRKRRQLVARCENCAIGSIR